MEIIQQLEDLSAKAKKSKKLEQIGWYHSGGTSCVAIVGTGSNE